MNLYRKLGVAGEEYEGVRTLRSPADANYIQNNCAGKEVVIVGGSFIGMEVHRGNCLVFSRTFIR